MKVIKRCGEEVTFSKTNIINAISQANQRVRLSERLTNAEIKEIAKEIEDRCKAETHAINVEDIQEFVDYVSNYRPPIGDMLRLANYGMVMREGSPQIVLLDSGLSDEIYNKYYKKY